MLTRIVSIEGVADNARAYTVAGIDRGTLPHFSAGVATRRFAFGGTT
jgi:hypothetical protein